MFVRKLTRRKCGLYLIIGPSHVLGDGEERLVVVPPQLFGDCIQHLPKQGNSEGVIPYNDQLFTALGPCLFQLANPSNTRRISKINSLYRARMQDVHRKGRVTKHQPSRARSGNQISCCIVPPNSCATSCTRARYCNRLIRWKVYVHAKMHECS